MKRGVKRAKQDERILSQPIFVRRSSITKSLPMARYNKRLKPRIDNRPIKLMSSSTRDLLHPCGAPAIALHHLCKRILGPDYFRWAGYPADSLRRCPVYSAHACKSSSWTRPCDRATPALCGCRSRSPKDALRMNTFSNRLFYCTLQDALVYVMALLPCSAGFRIVSDRSSRRWEEILPTEFSGSTRIFAPKRERQIHLPCSGA